MVSVCDEQFLIAHQSLHSRRNRGIGDAPQQVFRIVLISDLDIGHGLRYFVQQPVDRAFAIRIQHEKLAEVRMRMAQNFAPVFLGAGKRLLVTVHNARGVIDYFAQSDEPLAHQAFAGIGNGEYLKVRVERGFRILRKLAAFDPLLEVSGRASIHVVGFGVVWKLFAEDHPHQVVRTRSEIALLHRRVDLVIGLGYQVSNVARGRSVAKGSERKNIGHGSGRLQDTRTMAGRARLYYARLRLLGR